MVPGHKYLTSVKTKSIVFIISPYMLRIYEDGLSCMKFGICTNMNAYDRNKIGNDWLLLYKYAGLDYVELPLAEMIQASDRDRKKVAGQLTEVDIPCRACNNFFPARIPITGKDFNKKIFEAYTLYAMDLAASLGAEVVIFGSGDARSAHPP